MKIEIINFKNKNFNKEIESLYKNHHKSDSKTEKLVAKIISKIRENGDKAVISFCNKFDKTNFKKAEDLIVKEVEIDSALKNLSPNVLKAIETASTRIYDYHQKQLSKDFFYDDDLGNKLGNIWQAIEKIGVYIPGGTATYPSSVLMNVIPAIVAGCQDIAIATPSFKGKINDAVLASAKICNVKTIYKMGGAVAVSALGLGTKTVKRVDKIVGPGNSFVALAKKQLFGEVGIDMIAGPTDILIIADKINNPSWIASDLLSQLEHGVDSKAILITNCINFANQVNQSISNLTKKLSRAKIISKSIKKSAIIVVENLEMSSAEISNKIAPEHLQIITRDDQKILKQIKNAGAIFLGAYSPEAIGDYIAGPSHTLPTSGTARFASGLSTFDFIKRMSVINFQETGFKQLQEQAELLAEIEGFDAHKLSIKVRK